MISFLFETLACTGIMTILPIIIISLITFFFTPTCNAQKTPIAFAVFSGTYWIMIPVIMAQTNILNHSHNWLWYAGCSLCGILSFCIASFLIFKKGREVMKKQPLIFIPGSVLLTIGAVCIIIGRRWFQGKNKIPQVRRNTESGFSFTYMQN